MLLGIVQLISEGEGPHIHIPFWEFHLRFRWKPVVDHPIPTSIFNITAFLDPTAIEMS